jgi:succinoglycan biosynthesis transport protein ExoP
MADNAQTLSDYVAILQRRKMHFAVPAVLIFLAAIVLAFALPPVYRSTARILIESPQISTDIVASSVTGYAVERIQAINQQVMVYDNLWQIAQDLDLYPQERSPDTAAEIVGRMRANITMEMVSEDVVNPRTGRSGEVTSAFDLSFDSESPEAAQKVAERLAGLFLKENRESRTSQAEDTSSFLAAEAQRLNDQVMKAAAEMADFKRQNQNLLPQFASVNRELLERAEQQRNEVTASISEQESRRSLLQAQVAQMSGGYEERLTALRAELAAAREKFSDIHPDVLRLKRALASLEAEKNSGRKTESLGTQDTQTRSAYMALQSQLEAVTSSLEGNRLRLVELNKNIAEYEERIKRSPEVETEYLALNRDYENAVNKYGEIKDKQMQAQLSVQLEQEQKGERLSLLQSPMLPTGPIKPNRLGVALLGFMLAMIGGVGVAGIAEFRDHTIHGVRELVAVLKTQPIGIIPVIQGGTGSVK